MDLVCIRWVFRTGACAGSDTEGIELFKTETEGESWGDDSLSDKVEVLDTGLVGCIRNDRFGNKVKYWSTFFIVSGDWGNRSE